MLVCYFSMGYNLGHMERANFRRESIRLACRLCLWQIFLNNISSGIIGKVFLRTLSIFHLPGLLLVNNDFWFYVYVHYEYAPCIDISCAFPVLYFIGMFVILRKREILYESIFSIFINSIYSIEDRHFNFSF